MEIEILWTERNLLCRRNSLKDSANVEKYRTALAQALADW